MEIKQKIRIAIGVGLLVGLSIVLTRNSIKNKGYSKSKVFAKMFDVPYVEKMYENLAEKNKNILDSASENEQTKEGITFRATGTDPRKGKSTTGKHCSLGGTLCEHGKICIGGFCI